MTLQTDSLAVEAASFVMALRARGVRNVPVLRAMEQVPRDVFAPQRFRDLARTDVSLPLPCGQTMTAPAAVAAMLVALDVQDGHSILEIGTGSGYVTALLAHLGGMVVSIERYQTLLTSARERLDLMDFDSITLQAGDGLGLVLPEKRFDRILVNGSVLSLPPNLTSLIAPNGRLVGALQSAGFPRMSIVTRAGDGTLSQELGAALRLTPLVSGFAEAL